MYTHKNGILIKKIDETDIGFLLNLREDSWYGLHNFVLLNNNDQLKWLEKVNNSPTDIAFKSYLNTEKIGIGLISDINWINRSANISGSLTKNKRGLNLGITFFESCVDFAFEMYNLRRISLEVLETNKPSLSIIENHLKFVYEGKKRKAIFRFGKYLDSLLFSLLREEWLETDRIKSMNNRCSKNGEL